jgi:5-oxoprolinase (ATP-hydrolysing)
MRFRLLIAPGPGIPVSAYDPSTHVIELAEPPPDSIPSGSAFEVRSAEEAPILATRLVTGTSSQDRLPYMHMRLGTTLGTNALLERRGAEVALFITRGFADLLRIGTQQRDDLFALNVRKASPLYHVVVEVDERIGAGGEILKAVVVEELAEEVARIRQQGIGAAAVAFLHSYLNPVHENAMAGFLRASGYRYVSCSSRLAPLIKILPRAETAVADACLSPVVEDYLSRVRSAVGEGLLHVMTSAGGLVVSEEFRVKDSLLSGPAGGVVGAAVAGRQAGFDRILAFDMGGTSTDVARYDGDFEYVFEHQVGDAHLVAPALAIESVAAGGGSICTFRDGRLHVGPESAGAEPGPACYNAGGPLTLTDCNLLLGRLAPDRFEIPVSPDPATRRLQEILAELEAHTGERTTPEALVEGFLAIANERMAEAIRAVSVRRGYDPAEYALVAFGGAGAQHACGVADRLGTSTILVPEDASLLSAMGLGNAVIERFAERQILQTLETARPHVAGWVDELGNQASEAVAEEGIPPIEIEVRRRIVNLRFFGQESVLQVEFDPNVPLEEAFTTQYTRIFGHRPENRAIEIESIRVIASSKAASTSAPHALEKCFDAATTRTTRTFMAGRWLMVPAYARTDLLPGARVRGPALILDPHTATPVEPGWQADLDTSRTIHLRRSAAVRTAIERSAPPAGTRAQITLIPRAEVPTRAQHEAAAPGETRGDRPRRMIARPEAVELELFTNRFRAIAEEMGEMLRRTAVSTNVKERLDFSCALLDADAELVVNAPHIPVHLGSLGMCVRELRQRLPMRPGDVAITNHPACGGSHLPDVTIVTPVHAEGGELLGFVASRAHHAEIGGSRPGSMPPDARRLVEEGVVIPPMRLMSENRAQWDEIRRILSEGPFPSRAMEDNIADFRAAAAANHRGAQGLRALAAQHGSGTVSRWMEALKAYAEQAMRDALARLDNGDYQATEYLDDSTPLRVRISLAGDEATIDFAGTGGVHPANLNATPAIVHSAIMYVLRLLIDKPLPLNEGLMRPITVHVPGGLLNPAFPDDPSEAPAVVGGNVETSQRLVDTLLKALGLAACSQGTMNNVLFGNDRFGYYETVCGGCGAGPDFDGASAVHSHMTNTRATDPEVLEHRYPVRIDRFSVREGSGGTGRRRGGDGAVRELTFLDHVSLSVLSQHRTSGPYGLAGGQHGRPGAQRVIRMSGEVLELNPVDGCEIRPGDKLILETPGGGGYGTPSGA